MRARISLAVVASAALSFAGCRNDRVLDPGLEPGSSHAAKGAPKASDGFATLTKLPALSGGTHGEAYAVDQTGSIIAGYSWDRRGRMNPVKWTVQSGSWAITAFPYPGTATSATARGVNDQGDLAGNDFPASTPHPVLWPAAGGFTVLGCNDLGDVYGVSSGGQTVVGVGKGVSPATAAVWRPGSCREDLPPLVEGASAGARAVNGDGTIVGGSAAPSAEAGDAVAVRWTRSGGEWSVEQLDSRAGTVYGANSVGDLVGTARVACSSSAQCSRGIIWYAGGGSRDIGTLGGESTTPRGINAAGEVVGLSTLSDGKSAPFIWSEARGMRPLPVSDGAWAFAVSGVRGDGTRLVVGAGGKPFSALVWVVRN